MMFGEVRVDDAEALILAHSLRLPTAMLRKGRILTAEDVRALKMAGINFVTGARLDDTDVGEDEAARVLAEALAGDGINIGPAFSGRCNLFAGSGGILVMDRERLDRINLVDEAVTVATFPPYEIVAPRQMVTTVKIIPFGVDRRVMDACAAFASTGGPLISVRPFRPLKVSLVLTTLPGLKESVLVSTATVTRSRVEALNGTVILEQRCPHDMGSITRAIAKSLSIGADLVLVAGASGTVDRRDVVPAAIERSGGAIDHFGMPVDPGNLLLLGHVGSVPVVNLPGCGRSPKPNGLDWVLRRISAGIAIRPRDMMCMGAGGLLKETAPRSPHKELLPAHAAIEPRVAAILPVIGALDGETRARIAGTVEAALKSGLDPVMVVTDSEAVEEALPACDIRIIRHAGTCPPVAEGLAALPADIDAIMVLRADRPCPSTKALAEMVRAYDVDEGRSIVTTRGPSKAILVGSGHFAALAEAPAPESLLPDLTEIVFEVVTAEPGGT